MPQFPRRRNTRRYERSNHDRQHHRERVEDGEDQTKRTMHGRERGFGEEQGQSRFWRAELYTTNSEMSYEWRNFSDSERRNCIPRTQNVLWMRAAASEVKLVILLGTNFVGFFRGPKNWKNLGKMRFPIVNLAIYLFFFSEFLVQYWISKNSEKKKPLFTSNTTTRDFF